MFKCFCGCGPRIKPEEIEDMVIATARVIAPPSDASLIIRENGEIISITDVAAQNLKASAIIHTNIDDRLVEPLDVFLDGCTGLDGTPVGVRYVISKKHHIINTLLIRFEVAGTPFYVVKFVPADYRTRLMNRAITSTGSSGHIAEDILKHFSHNIGNTLLPSVIEVENLLRTGEPLRPSDHAHVGAIFTQRTLQLEAALLASDAETLTLTQDLSVVLAEFKGVAQKWAKFRPSIEVEGLETFTIPEGFRVEGMLGEATSLFEVLYLRMILYAPEGKLTFDQDCQADKVSISMEMTHQRKASATPKLGSIGGAGVVKSPPHFGMEAESKSSSSGARDFISPLSLSPTGTGAIGGRRRAGSSQEIYARASSIAQEDSYGASIDSQIGFLTNSPGFIEKMDATIKVNAGPTSTKITFSLGVTPRSPGTPPTPLLGTPVIDDYSRYIGTPLKVLIVDDEKTNRRLAGRMTEQIGGGVTYKMCEAAEDVPAIIAKDPYAFDLILMDIVMNRGESGDATSKKLKADHPHLCIVPMTANTSVADKVKYDAAGMDCTQILGKPFTKEDMGSIYGRYQKKKHDKLAARSSRAGRLAPLDRAYFEEDEEKGTPGKTREPKTVAFLPGTPSSGSDSTKR